jgi:hypothetical protein
MEKLLASRRASSSISFQISNVTVLRLYRLTLIMNRRRLLECLSVLGFVAGIGFAANMA